MKKTILITSLVLLILAVIFDKELALFFVSYRSPFLTALMFSFSFIGSFFMVFLLTTLLFVKDRRKRHYIPALWLTLLAAAGIGLLLKYFIARPRPNLMPLEVKDSFSFPSIHAVAVFAPLALLDLEYPKLKWFWLGIAVIVVFSRLYLGSHYLSDVIAGALIGYIAGLLVLIATKNA